ncbi:hypothetical protein CMO91_03350 [Candidatus Woesearchaeota archaeon]|jgi:hypothetical protein|nr:hypothetical protein [Candidatus Woesearchaeota archaeon]|tara:strand:+ start:370 stop:699 length:330 start_codon:yes stop_codon:yes gene_type:complete
MKCHKCSGELIEDDLTAEMDGYIFVIKGKKCISCGEEIIGEKEGQRMVQAAKKLGVWGQPLKLHRKLSKSARGTVLRIPTDIETNMKLKGTEKVAISKLGDKKILVEIE